MRDFQDNHFRLQHYPKQRQNVSFSAMLTLRWGWSLPLTNARLQRRLAAILAADSVGYLRLVGFDEVGPLAALKAHRSEATE